MYIQTAFELLQAVVSGVEDEQLNHLIEMMKENKQHELLNITKAKERTLWRFKNELPRVNIEDRLN